MEINEKDKLFKTGGVLGRRISKGGKRRKERGIAESSIQIIKIWYNRQYIQLYIEELYEKIKFIKKQ